MLYEPTRFDALIDEPWVPARVEDAIAAIVADADAAFDPTALWPAHEWDAREKPLPLSGLYVGAAGVIWALDELQERGRAESSRDLAAAVVRAVELERATPDFSADEHYRPGALMSGETGALLVAFRLTADPALAMGERTGEPRWEEAARESATALRARRGDDGLWRQDDDYRGLTTLHGVAGNTLALLRFEPDDAVASESAAVLSRHAFREDGLANWPGAPRPQLARPRDGRICLQWCTGAPGVVAGAWEYLDEDLLLAGAELIWRAGAHRDEKGHGLCHGTSGNGFAFLKAFARTGDERWLARARRFAMHALEQVRRLREERGRGRYSLWTGDAGAALFAADCVEARSGYPVLDSWEW